MKLRNLLYEIQDYGFKEVWLHLMKNRTGGENSPYKIKELQERDRVLRKMSQKKLKTVMQRRYRHAMNEELNIDSPVSYSEKLQWLKLYDVTPEKTRLADKYLVREWIKEQLGDEKCLIPLIGAYDHFDEIDFEALPNEFCLKTNHGCGMNYVVKDKSLLTEEDIKKLKTLVEEWMETPFYVENLEIHYRDIPRKILIEKYIEDMDGDLLDYKIHCFDGKPKLIQIIGNRDLKKHTANEVTLDVDWNPSPLMYSTYDQYDVLPQKPAQFERMLEMASVLSKDFIYVRVDLYEIANQILFGEMTFTPGAGFGKWKSQEANLKAGELIHIP